MGATVTVQGVVTAEPGRLGTPALLSIADASGGIVVRLPDGLAAPGRGALIRVTGPLADPYGQLEVRPSATNLRIVGTGVLPSPLAISASDLGEATEAKLATIVGVSTTAPDKGTSGDLTFELTDLSGSRFRVAADGSSGIKATDLPRNQALRLVGLVGQHASRKGALDGYRIWLRDRADIVVVAGTGPSPLPSAGTGSMPISIAAALGVADGTIVTVDGTVTAGVSLLDSSGRRIVVQDESGAIEVLLPAGTAAPAVGSRLRVTGARAHAWDAPRVRATAVAVLSSRGAGATPAARAATLGPKDEWRLVRMTGALDSVHRIGDRWTAELRLANGDRIALIGQAGAGIPSTLLAEGQTATVVGIVKRPYPTATDRRFALLPRSRADLTLIGGAGGAAGGTMPATGGSGASGPERAGGIASGTAESVTPDTDLATLFEHIGETVRVGGLITELDSDGFLLDDGTAVAKIVLSGDAAPLLGDLQAGEAVSARGVVRQDDEALSVVVSGGGDLARIGDLGEGLPVGSTAPGDASASPGAVQPEALGLGDGGGLLPEEVSLATLLALTIASLLVTLLRRRASMRRSRAVVLGRIASLGRPRPPAAPPG
ncbi:MAG TPA: hypothetical protein VFW20_09220 [Candidatus Limnocylindrales bacterium]|nr:hypothetical protein [Candidatus Limnocylindrales bacterium]